MTAAGARELIALGVLTRPHGVRGEVRMHVYNPGSDLVWRLAELEAVWLRPSADGAAGAEPSATAEPRPDPSRRARIERVRQGPKGPLVTVEGARGRDGAEGLRGLEVCVRRQDLPPIEDGDEHYVVDLVGLRVRGEDGRAVGKVVGVESYPSVSCLRVCSEGEPGEREVPLAEPWVQRVDLEAGEVIVGDIDDVPVQGT